MVLEATTTGERTDFVGRFCAQVPRLTTGRRAALRRLFLTQSAEATGTVTGMLIGANIPDEAWSGTKAFERWKLLAHVAAVLSGTGAVAPHQPGYKASFGGALHAVAYSELRLMRLTSARGSALVDQIVRAARMLGAAGKAPVDLRPVFELSRDEGEWAEKARLRIARDFYGAAASAPNQATAKEPT